MTQAYGPHVPSHSEQNYRAMPTLVGSSAVLPCLRGLLSLCLSFLPSHRTEIPHVHTCKKVNDRAPVTCLVQIEKDLGTPDKLCRIGIEVQKVKLFIHSLLHLFIYIKETLADAVDNGNSEQ